MILVGEFDDEWIFLCEPEIGDILFENGERMTGQYNPDLKKIENIRAALKRD